MGIIKPKIRTFKVTFPNSEAMFEFDRYLEDIVGMRDKMVGVPTVSAYDDGCVNEFFQLRKGRPRNFCMPRQSTTCTPKYFRASSSFMD